MAEDLFGYGGPITGDGPMSILRAVPMGLLLALVVGVGVPLQLLCVAIGDAADRHSMTWLCRLLLRLLRVRLRTEAQDQGVPGRLVVANHVSWLDALALRSMEPLSFTAKREVGRWPLVATVARLQRTIFIDRQRKREIPRVNREMAAQLDQGRSVLLFPEGTTNDGSRRGRFLTSHLGCLAEALRLKPDRPSVAVQAVGIAYSDPAAAWVGDASLLPHLWSVLVRPPVTCTLTFGNVSVVERNHDRKALGRELAGTVERLLAAGKVARSYPAPGPDAIDAAARRRPSIRSAGRRG